MPSQPDTPCPPMTRRDWVCLLAQAHPDALRHRVEAWVETGGEVPRYTWLRRPQVGLVMVRARADGGQEPFNLGEMTATRCSLALEDGTHGHAYIGGRDIAHCERAAWIDALLQGAAWRPMLEREVLAPLQREAAARRAQALASAAGTRVNFFTIATEEFEA